ncbi:MULTISPECIES: ATP-binding protein [Pseudomonas]|jgi:two-component system OmpR family sensor kinase|uniref:ATP-binding protein n=1 Tax=Pseudomonas TaxID=286 RepID=UPI000876F17F|nr:MULTISPECIES: ATP-binding protein [Pseudomonas]UVM09678.1 sensor histidine kinase N-terminal domain-containing protein [Pseudomonas protegens]SCZ61627.1 two-component system, OmpR family, sensor kinase [Pseudomonas sp. NFPP17]SDA56234.1 two-component system, OmpR family, sensor kinase [Pseudomonas sp. NFPP15]SEK76170.1 two-component system, OmpR family, sensor kinase [Pseudomonas sp. NFPP18]SFA54509.1 two-component system, OmpR family, sensor kinase [Pseudomonas sp. NFPP13]
MDGFKRRLSESVQLRLSIALSVAVLIVALLAGVFAYVSAFDEALEMQDNTLRQVAALFERQHMTLAYPPPGQVVADDNEESRVVVQYLADGARAAADSDAEIPLPLPTTLADGLSTLTVGGEPFRVLVKTTSAGLRIAVAQETGARDRDARESAWRGLLPFLILFPVLLLVIADLVRKLFRPIEQLAAEIDLRDEQELHPIDERHLPTEVRPFVRAINRLLLRVTQSMTTQRRFVADAAHELRSPLTALSLQAERLASVEMPSLARERLQLLRRGIERGRKLIDQLLGLASAQSAINGRVEPVSVHGVYRRVLEDLLPLAEDKAIDIGLEGGPDRQVLISQEDLLTLVKNLVDNAIRYTPQGGRVDLSVVQVQDEILLQVSDSGPGIAVAERERVFDPFHRGLGSDEVGSGLGLAIVKAIADRHAGRVWLDYSDQRAKRGLCVTVAFARVQVPPAG